MRVARSIPRLMLLSTLAMPELSSTDAHPPGSPSSSPTADVDREVDRDVDRELAEAVERVMVVQFKRRLALSDSQAEAVTPLMTQLVEERRDHARRRRDALRSLIALAEDSTADEDVLRDKMAAIDREDQEFLRVEKRLLEDVKSHLDVRQQARLMLFQERFREEMRQRVDEARGRGRAGGPGPPRPPRAEGRRGLPYRR